VFLTLTLFAVLALAHGFDNKNKHPQGNQNDEDDEGARAVVGVSYNVWYHPDPQSAEHIGAVQNVRIEDKSSFYDVMVEAANNGDDDNAIKFRFTGLNYTFGYYVTSIGGYAENQFQSVYWILYKYPNGVNPDPQNPPPDSYSSDLGVDAIQVSDGDVYLFWRKNVAW